MIQLFLYYLLAMLVVAVAIWSMIRPSASIGLFISLYATEQILLSQFQWDPLYGQLYNFGVGSICAIAIMRALFTNGMPPVPVHLGSVFFILMFLVCASLLWTPAPNTAGDWIQHFVIEGSLAFILPIATLRSRDDFAAPMQVTIVIAVITAIWTLASPLGPVGGRVSLIESATVLSPATLMGVAMIALAIMSTSILGVLGRIRILPIAILAGGLFVSGARGQFLAAVALSAWFVVTMRMSRQISTLVGVLAVIVMAIVLGASVLLLDMDVAGLPMEGRYSAESLESGFDVRLAMIEKSLTFDRPFFGHGVGGWSFMENGMDRIPRAMKVLKHPHNSLAQAFYEIGFVGLALFLMVVWRGLSSARGLWGVTRSDPVLRSLVAMTVAYLGFEFLMSLKQATFMAALGLYLSISMLEALRLIYRIDFLRSSEGEGDSDLLYAQEGADGLELGGLGDPLR